jgi:hypothetical protein
MAKPFVDCCLSVVVYTQHAADDHDLMAFSLHCRLNGSIGTMVGGVHGVVLHWMEPTSEYWSHSRLTEDGIRISLRGLVCATKLELESTMGGSCG